MDDTYGSEIIMIVTGQYYRVNYKPEVISMFNIMIMHQYLEIYSVALVEIFMLLNYNNGCLKGINLC